jgi:hypothetical protein
MTGVKERLNSINNLCTSFPCLQGSLGFIINNKVGISKPKDKIEPPRETVHAIFNAKSFSAICLQMPQSLSNVHRLLINVPI